MYPKHSRDRALLLAEERIQNPGARTRGDIRSYEHHVGTWACTMLSKHFQDDFLITPEMFTYGTNKKPDFTIEKYYEEAKDKSKYHAVYELKKQDGGYLDKALEQASLAISQLCDKTDGSIEMFVIVQRGMEIGFFEYLSYTSMMDEAGILQFASCVPLTYVHKDLIFRKDEAKDAIMQLKARLPDSVQTLVYGQSGRRSTDSLARADEIDTPCVFNLKMQKDEIDFLFHYIATQKPRKMED